MISVLVVIIYSLACLGAGHLVLRRFVGDKDAPVPIATAPLIGTAFILGQALLAAALLVIGLTSLLTHWVIGILLAVTLAAGFPSAWSRLRLLPAVLREEVSHWTREPLVVKMLGFGLAMLVLGHGLAAYLKPPIGDAEAFYVTYAKIMAASERLIPMPGFYADFSTIGLMGEMHFAALISLDGTPAAKLFVWPVALAAGAILFGICGLAGLNHRGRWLAIAILFTSSTFTHYISDGKVDLFAAALGLGAFFWLLVPGSREARCRVLPLAGLLGGFAAVAKFSYIPGFLPALLLFASWRSAISLKDAGYRSAALAGGVALDLMVIGLWAAIATIPHLLKNAVMFGAPLAPFIGGLQDKTWLGQVWFSAEVTRQILLTYPLALVFGRYPMQGGGLSFLLSAFLPLAFFLPRPRAWLRDPLVQLTAAALIGTLVWVALCPSIIAPRYFLATLILLFPLAAHGAEQVIRGEAGPRLLTAGVTGVMALAMVFSAYHLLPLPKAFFNHLTGKLPECSLASPYCAPLTALNRIAAPGERVFLAGYYGYWLRPDLLQCRDNAVDYRLFQAAAAEGPAIETIYQRGFTYLILDKTSHARETEQIMSAPRPGWIDLIKVSGTPELLILKLTAKDPTHQPKVLCRQINPPAWEIATIP